MNKITLVLGTAREGNFSQKVAEVVQAHLESMGHSVNFVDVADFAFGHTIAFAGDSEPVKPWVDAIASADGVIFVCPEYNHSYPGELKMLIDSLYAEYTGKVAGIVSVSAGQFGGVRVVEALKILLHTVNFKISNKSVNVGGVQKDIDEKQIKSHVEGMVKDMAAL